jgi:hypothetical protein
MNLTDTIYSLDVLDNYKMTLNCNVNYITNKYNKLVIEFIKFILEQLKIDKVNLFKFIVLRGYDTMSNVFLIMLFYTKNIDLTFYYCQKSYYYYVEYINQILEVQNVYLNLSSRDAITYVYTKTIYEINHTIKKNISLNTNNDTNDIFDLINEYSKTYRNIIEIILNHVFINQNQNQNQTMNTIIIDKLEIICDKFNIIQFEKLDNYLTLNKFINIIFNTEIEINNLFEILFLIVKNLIKNKNNINKINKNIISAEILITKLNTIKEPLDCIQFLLK